MRVSCNFVNVYTIAYRATCSDLTFSSLCVPFIAYHYAADNWTIGGVACRLSQYLIYVTTYVTVYTLVAVAVVRVYKVTAMSATSAVTSRDDRHVNAAGRGGGGGGVRQVSLVVAALWSVAVTANLPVVFSYRVKTYVTSSFNATDDVVAQPYSYCGIEDETQGRRLKVLDGQRLELKADGWSWRSSRWRTWLRCR